MRGPVVLALNAGSSSLRFALHAGDASARRVLAGEIERIGTRGAIFHADGEPPRDLGDADHRAVTTHLLDWLEARPRFADVVAVGHRVVHGMRRTAPTRITPRVIAELRRLVLLDPDHLPHAIALVEAVAARRPRLPQVACFDTAFHRTMPAVARRLALPRRLAAKGVERYGFHGLSFAYVIEELAREDPAAARGRVIVAHLGGGASLAAVRDGRSVDTSMGFTPAAGVMMGTRSGDLDPGIFYYLARREGMSAARMQRMINHESGLLGVSGTSSDVRDLLAREPRDPRAAEALELFVYQIKKWIGAFAAALGGLDALVFTGGIGEHAAPIRARVCAGLDLLGVALDARRNARGVGIISARTARVTVRVIPTDEERMIARTVTRFIHTHDARAGRETP